MLGFAQRQPDRAKTKEWLPVKRGSTLLAAHYATLARIRSMVGVPRQHWRLLYEALFAAYAEYVQQIPVPETAANSESTPLLQRALESVELALKIRRGYVLPPGKEPEIVADEQDAWTYAVATAALLKAAGPALINQRVTLHDRDRKPLGVWSPLTGPMTRSGTAYYRVDVRQSTEGRLAESALPLLVPYIVPEDGLRWLVAHEDALAAWLATISGHATDAAVITEIVRKASQASGAASLLEQPALRTADNPSNAPSRAAHRSENPGLAAKTEPIPEEDLLARGRLVDSDDAPSGEGDAQNPVPVSGVEADDPGEAFLQWLTNGITSGTLSVNTAKSHVHVVDAGLLLASPAVFRAFTGENWREVQKRFLKRKLTAKAANGENVFHYWQMGDRGRRTIKGMLIRNAEQQLGISLPTINPRLAPKPDKR